ncbi:hypothetical protein B0H19DRAFT_95949 [Mycena capillaripes]|nr:hypothetical protein B0H19DRAFT_95949 [Mycena capillaripes]
MSRAVELCVRCGYSPSAEILADTTYDRVQLRLRLAQITNVIATLSAERQRLQAVSDSIVYPVLSLPPEIMSLIFIHCLPESISLPQPSPLKAPLLLAQICAQWREIAIGTPELWQSIGLVDTRSVGIFETWLARSGNLPLNFSLNCVDLERASSLIDLCISHVHRWQDVELALPFGILIRLEHLMPIPLLRKISLSLRGPFSTEGAPDNPIALLNAPMLRRADVGTYPDLRFNLPWAQLTSLTLAKVDVAECFSILKLCPDLITLDIFTAGTVETVGPVEPLTLAFLDSLTFATDFCPFADHLCLPRLTHLHIRETVAADDAYSTHLHTLLSRSTAPLQRLVLALKYPTSTTFAHTLAALPVSPALHTLELHCGNATHLAPLLAVLQPPEVLPALAALHIAGGRVFDDDYDAVPALLQARVGTLREFALLVQTYGRADAVRDVPLRMRALPRLEQLASDGMKIRMAIAGRFRVGTEVLIDALS